MNRGPLLAGGGIMVGLALAALVSTCGGPDAARSVAPAASLDRHATAHQLVTDAVDERPRN